MRAPGPGIPMFNVVQLLTAKSSGSHSVYPRRYLHAALETIVITLIVTWAFTWKFYPVEPSYPVGYIGSLYLLEESGWPLSPPPSSDLLVAVFIVVTALLPTSDCRSVSTRRGVHFVFPAHRP